MDRLQGIDEFFPAGGTAAAFQPFHQDPGRAVGRDLGQRMPARQVMAFAQCLQFRQGATRVIFRQGRISEEYTRAETVRQIQDAAVRQGAGDLRDPLPDRDKNRLLKIFLPV